MGGAVAILYTLKYPDVIKGIILLSPMCGITLLLNKYWITINFLLYLSYFFPSRKLINFKNNNTTRSIEYTNASNNCIYSNKDPIRLDTGRECYYMIDSIKNNTHKFTCNVLAYHSITDTITSPDCTKDFINKCSSTNKELILLQNGDHSILLPINNLDDTISILENIGMWIKNI
jgi:alpha-beta hydrolase superfamily lysophospholipase